MSKSGTDSLIATAALQWQLGNWQALADIPAEDASARTRQALGLYRILGVFQTGDIAAARALAAELGASGTDPRVLAETLLSGAYSSLSRAWIALDATAEAQRNIEAAVSFAPGNAEPSVVAALRFSAERHAIEQAVGTPLCRPVRRNRLFIDCGGNDGCSALAFLLEHPDYDCISFEPNPDLWHHYAALPTTLHGKAVYTYDGEIRFTVDPVDGDGSSVIEGKRVDATRAIANADCPVLLVPCVDLSRVVREQAALYDEVVLKLDVEGAEYDILEKMLEDGTLRHVRKLYCEFHKNKIPIEAGRHASVVSRTTEVVGPIEYWDAQMLRAGSDNEAHLRRAFLTGLVGQLRKEVQSGALRHEAGQV